MKKTAHKLVQSSKFKIQNYGVKFISLTVFFFLTFNFALLTFNLSEAKAQTVRSFTISPPTLKFSLKPGQKTERTIKITNNSTQTQEYVVTMVDFIVTNKSGTPELLPAGTPVENKYAASTWTTALPDTLVIPPGKSATTVLYIQVPGDARPGGRYVSVAFQPKSGAGPEGTGAAVNTVAASLVYLTVLGPTKEEGRITAFSAPPFSEYGPINISTEIKNLGDIHITPKGTLEVKNLLGRKVFSAALDNFNIFPGTSRTYDNSWQQKWLFGRFTATLDGYFGQENNIPLVAMATFWVIPYKLITIILLAIVIALAAYFFLRGKKEEEVEEETTPQ